MFMHVHPYSMIFQSALQEYGQQVVQQELRGVRVSVDEVPISFPMFVSSVLVTHARAVGSVIRTLKRKELAAIGVVGMALHHLHHHHHHHHHDIIIIIIIIIIMASWHHVCLSLSNRCFSLLLGSKRASLART